MTKRLLTAFSCFKATIQFVCFSDQTPAVRLRDAGENTKRCFLLPEMWTGRLILGTTWLLLSTAGSWLHTVWRHVSSLDFIHPSCTVLPADISIPLFKLSLALLRFVLRGRLAPDYKRQEWLREDSSPIFPNLPGTAFVFGSGLRV